MNNARIVKTTFTTRVIPSIFLTRNTGFFAPVFLRRHSVMDFLRDEKKGTINPKLSGFEAHFDVKTMKYVPNKNNNLSYYCIKLKLSINFLLKFCFKNN